MRLNFLAVMAFLTLASSAMASGFRPPAHSDLSYAFTCPSGASGHLQYTVDFDLEYTSKLTLWVNGKYVQEDADVSRSIRGLNIEQLQASCEGEHTRVWLRTFDPKTSQQGTIAIDIDLSGKVLSAQSAT